VNPRRGETCGASLDSGNPADGAHIYYFVFTLFKHQFNCYRLCIQEKGLTAYVINRLNAACYWVHNSSIPRSRETYVGASYYSGEFRFTLWTRGDISHTFIASCSGNLNANSIDSDNVPRKEGEQHT